MRDSEWAIFELLRFTAPPLDNVLGALALGYFFLLRWRGDIPPSSAFKFKFRILYGLPNSHKFSQGTSTGEGSALVVPVLRWYNVGDRKACQVTRYPVANLAHAHLLLLLLVEYQDSPVTNHVHVNV